MKYQNESTLAIFFIFIACQSTLAQWLATGFPLDGLTQISRLQQLGTVNEGIFAICYPTSAPNERHFCRTTVFACCLEGRTTFNMTTISPAPISTFGALRSPQQGTNDLQLTGGLASPIAPSGIVSSSFAWSIDRADGLSFAPQFFGTVVASSFDVFPDDKAYVYVQYHLAYNVDRSSNTFQWLVQRVVAGRSGYDHAWEIGNFIAPNCSTAINTDLIQATITTYNGAKLWSVAFGGSTSCAGLYQFVLPSTLASTEFSTHGSPILFTSTAIVLNDEKMFFANGSLCRINLGDLQKQCRTTARRFQETNWSPSQLAIDRDRLFAVFNMNYVEAYGFDLQTRDRYMPINVSADALLVTSNFVFMTYREVRNGKVTAMVAFTTIDSFVNYNQLTNTASMTTVPTIYSADVVVGLAISLAIVGILAIVGWALFIALRVKKNAHIKPDTYAMLNERLTS